jgi:leucyl aminopeptidase
VIASAENMPSSTAYRPDDVVTTLSGKTVEIGNTDAEGRIVLSDALAYAQREFEPAAIIDLATLTGACAVALGTWCSAVLGTNERLIEALRRAGEATHERVWPLPLWSEHQEFMKGRVADLKQVGGRNGGTIIAAAFLSHFVGETPWAHLDIAPTANSRGLTLLNTGPNVRVQFFVPAPRGHPRGRRQPSPMAAGVARSPRRRETR